MNPGTLLASALLLTSAQVQHPGPAKEQPRWVLGLELVCRRAGDAKFTPKTPRWGVEIFNDGGAALAISQTGKLAVASGLDPKLKDIVAKAPLWLYALELEVPKAKALGVETYLEPNIDRQVYVSETGFVALAAKSKHTRPLDRPAPAKFLHAEDLAVGKDTTWRIGIVHDGNSGNVVFTSSAGGLAVVSGFEKAPAAKPLRLVHRLELKCRLAGEAVKFITHEVHVYREEATGTWLFLSHTGALAAVRAPAGMLGPPRADWLNGFVIGCRPAGEFPAEIRRFGVDCYRHEASRATLYVAETGAIAVP